MPNDPALSLKDSSILSSEDSIMQRRRLRESLEREFGLGTDYSKYPRGNYGPEGFFHSAKQGYHPYQNFGRLSYGRDTSQISFEEIQGNN